MRYLVLLVLLTGCMTAEKAKRNLDKIENEYPELISEICAVEYPCIPRKADTVLRTEYDFIEVECPDGQLPLTSKDSTDTIYIIKYNGRVTKEVRIPCESKVITQYIEDSAKVTDLTNRLGSVTEDYIKAQAKAKRYSTYTKILGLLLALIILAFYLSQKWFKKR